jgi:hypothetical protein
MHNAYNNHNFSSDLLGLSVSLETQIPENVIDQMNDIFVHKIHFLHKSSLCRLTAIQNKITLHVASAS